ncbi:MAG: hypothetical protein AAF755_01770 [Pseudomonadota bacterium]
MNSISFDARLLDTPEGAETVAAPDPQPFSAPVLIQDAVTPLVGETVLSLLIKKMSGPDQP